MVGSSSSSSIRAWTMSRERNCAYFIVFTNLVGWWWYGRKKEEVGTKVWANIA